MKEEVKKLITQCLEEHLIEVDDAFELMNNPGSSKCVSVVKNMFSDNKLVASEVMMLLEYFQSEKSTPYTINYPINLPCADHPTSNPVLPYYNNPFPYEVTCSAR